MSISYIVDSIKKYTSYFKAHRYNNTDTAINYVLGLIKCAKGEANMERMEEEIQGTEYKAYQHFITNSNWDSEGLQKAVAFDSSQALSVHKQKSKKPTGYIIDESAH